MPKPKCQSSFDKYRAHLTVLKSDLPLVAALNRVGIDCEWWEKERPWVRKFGRFNPGVDPFVTMMFETLNKPQEICILEFLKHFSAAMEGPEFLVQGLPDTWCRVIRFPADPCLPGLSKVLDDPIGAPRVVRYRPGKRCTIRFDVPSPESSRFAKVFPNQAGAQIHKESVHLWEASNNHEVGFSTASPLGWDPETQTIWQGMVKGEPVLPRLGGLGAVDLVSRIASAVASISISSLKPALIFNWHAQMNRTIAYMQKLKLRAPNLSKSGGELLGVLSGIHQRYENEPLFPIHGAPHAHQWLDDGKRLGLVDFDRFSLGDRELDVATFLTELEWEGTIIPIFPQLKKTFLSTYESIAGPLNPTLLWAYRAHKYLARACKATQSVRPDGEERASKALERAFPIPAGLS